MATEFSSKDIFNEEFTQELVELVQVLQMDAKALEALHNLTEIIRKNTSSNAVRIYWINRTSEGPSVTELYSSEKPKPSSEEALAKQLFTSHSKLVKDKGLVRWVIEHNDWLIANDLPPFEIKPWEFHTERNRIQKIIASSSQIFDAEDDERAMCVLPLTSEKFDYQLVLILGRNRNKLNEQINEDYTPEMVERLKKEIPLITTICLRVIELAQMIWERHALEQLTLEVQEQKCIHEVSEILLREIGKLARAHCALMISGLENGKSGHCNAIWHSLDKNRSGLPKTFYEEFRHFSTNNFSSIEKILQNINRKLNFKIKQYKARKKALQASNTLIVLIDQADINFDKFTPADSQSLYKPCEQVLYYSETLRLHYKKAHTRAVIKKLSENISGHSYTDSFEQAREDLIQKTLEALREVTRCDSAILYLGNKKGVTISGIIPERPKEAFRVGESSLTARVIRDKLPILIPDITSENVDFKYKLGDERRQIITKALDWKDITSWCCCPITLPDKKTTPAYGAIKLLTKESGVMLDQDILELTQAVAQRTFWEYDQIIRQFALHELNQMGSALAGATGAGLRNGLIKSLEDWSNKYIQRGCKVAIYTYRKDGSDLVYAASEALGENFDKTIRGECKKPPSARKKQIAELYLLYQTVNIKSDDRFTGQLIFLNEQAIDTYEIISPKEIGSEVSIIIYQEYLRMQREEDAALLRHSILGPIQGLANHASEALLEAELAGVNPKEFEQIQQGIARETEIIRRWRDIGKMVGEGQAVIIKPQKYSFIKLFEACINRFKNIAAERNIKIKKVIKPDSKDYFYFDKLAIDILLSNLLDNATKYAFFNTEIIASYSSDKYRAHIKIINTGHKLPEHNIFELGTRLNWRDPYRVIAGEGFGLAICKSLVKAHGGHISPNCKAASRIESEKQRFLVEFYITLPIRH